MELSIKVEATRRGLNAVTRKLDPEVLYSRVRDSLEDTLKELVLLVRQGTPEDTGRAAEATYYRLEGDSIYNLEGRVANPESYFATLNYGRRAGAAYPPPEPIAEWAERHGISQNAIFPIQRAISQRGLPAYHILERAIARGRGHFKAVFLKRYIELWKETDYDSGG